MLTQFLLLLALGTAAYAQTDFAWTDGYTAATSERFVSFGVVTRDDGGGVAAFGVTDVAASPTPTGRAVVRSFDENGNRDWTREIDFGTSGIGRMARGTSLAYSPTGDVILAVGSGASLRLLAIDPTGNVRWIVPSGEIGLNYLDFGFTDDGDVYVGTLGRLECRDRWTGALRWERSQFTYVETNFAFGDGDAYWCLTPNISGFVQRYDKNGAIVDTFNAPGVGAFAYPLAMLPDGAGGVIAAIRSTGGFFSCYVHSISSNGTVNWGANLTNCNADYLATRATDGDVLVLAYESQGSHLHRIDPQTGAIRWSHAAPPEFAHRYRWMSPTPSNGACLTGWATTASMGLGLAGIEYVDANGQTVGLDAFDSVPAEGGEFGRLDVDARGNAWVPVTVADSSDEAVGIRTVKVVPGGVQSATECAQTVPNSTGATARLRGVGSATVAVNNLTLLVDQLPPGAALFGLVSDTAASTPNAGGSQGTLCLGGAIGRYVGPGQVLRANAFGAASLQLELSEVPTPVGPTSAVAGQTLRFQVWHRDANPSPTSNFSNGIAVPFL